MQDNLCENHSNQKTIDNPVVITGNRDIDLDDDGDEVTKSEDCINRKN